MTPQERFAAKTAPHPCGCLRWTAGHDEGGYGQFWLDGRTRPAHKVAYEWEFGSVPAGHNLDHVKSRGCLFRDCVLPAHLETVTPGENALRGRGPAAENARKTRCPAGHPYSGVSGGRRRCVLCLRRQSKESYHRRKAQYIAGLSD